MAKLSKAYSPPKNSSSSFDSSFLSQEQQLTPPESPCPYRSPVQHALDHEARVLSTIILLRDRTPLCSACKQPYALEMGDCGHHFCPDCLQDETKLKKNSKNTTCSLCLVVNEAKENDTDLLPRYLQDYATEDKIPRRKSTLMLSPDITKMMMNDAGALVLKPEFEHLDLNYKVAGTPGSYFGAYLKDESVALRQAYQQIRSGIVTFWSQQIVSPVQALKLSWTQTKETIKITVKTNYEVVATPVKNRFLSVAAILDKVRARRERENRAVKSEFELIKLKLAETRLQLRERNLMAKGRGVTLGVKLLWALLFIGCVLAIAWFADFLFLDMGFDAYKEWLEGSS